MTKLFTQLLHINNTSVKSNISGVWSCLTSNSDRLWTGKLLILNGFSTEPLKARRTFQTARKMGQMPSWPGKSVKLNIRDVRGIVCRIRRLFLNGNLPFLNGNLPFLNGKLLILNGPSKGPENLPDARKVGQMPSWSGKSVKLNTYDIRAIVCPIGRLFLNGNLQFLNGKFLILNGPSKGSENHPECWESVWSGKSVKLNTRDVCSIPGNVFLVHILNQKISVF